MSVGSVALQAMPERVVSWLYHDVTDSPAESGFQNAMAQAYKHSVDRFTFDLALILAGNCTVRTVRDLARKANEIGRAHV